MTTVLTPPLEPMLGKLVRELPEGDYCYEPKWDGFRCLAFCADDQVDLRSRNDRPLARYFPEVVDSLRELSTSEVTLDGELVAFRDGLLDFASLMGRLHPAASRVERLRLETPAIYVAFDLLAVDGEILCRRPFRERRLRLEQLLNTDLPGVRLTPITADRETAFGWLHRYGGGGIDGVMAKGRESPYLPGKREMLKVKLERTADCVVAGARPALDEPGVASLLLGLYDEGGALVHVGVASGFARARRRELWRELAPLAIPLGEHPWREGYLVGGGPMGRLRGAAGRWTPDMELDWLPLEPIRVCEVAYDQVDGTRLRHAARFRRWREDRDASSCKLEQFAPDAEQMPPPFIRLD